MASLQKIWEFYRIKNKTAADKMIAGIIQTAERILYAEQFQQEEFLYERHRRAIYKHFKIIYTKTSNGIEILQIFDSRQDPSKMNL